jgi:hypothetical protein
MTIINSSFQGKHLADMTTIPVTKETRDVLKAMGRKGETYDKILRRMVSQIRWEEFVERQYGKLQDRSKFVPLEEIE